MPATEATVQQGSPDEARRTAGDVEMAEAAESDMLLGKAMCEKRQQLAAHRRIFHCMGYTIIDGLLLFFAC